MVKGCASTALKFVFFTLNLLFFLAGVLTVAAGIWLRVDSNFQKIVTEMILKSGANIPPPEGLYIALYIIIALGAVMLLTGFFGCCGAWCESTCMLGLFFSVVLTLFCVEIAGAAYLYFKQEDMKTEFGTWYKTYILPRTVGPQRNEELAKSLDTVHEYYKCCGATGCSDYREMAAEPPLSCKCNVPGISTNTSGCTDKLYKDIYDNWRWGLLALGIILLLELAAMICACCICNAVRQGAMDYYY